MFEESPQALSASEGSSSPALISVITPVYNGSQYLEALIQSVQAQTHPRIEHIVIDDGSNDSGATLAVLARHPHVRWWTRPNRGQYATLNEGLSAASGDWICIISADDLLAAPTAFARLLAEADHGKQFDAIYGRTELMDESGTPIVESSVRPDESSPKWLNYHFLAIHHCSMLVARRFVNARRLFFDTSLRFTGDWDWIIRILRAGRTRYVDVPVSRYRLHEQQTRQTARRADLVEEDRKVLARYGSSYLLHRLVINYIRLRKLITILISEGIGSAWKKVSGRSAQRP